MSSQAYLIDRAERSRSDGEASPCERRVVAAELLRVRRLLAGLGASVNELAAAANTTGEVEPDELATLLATVQQRLPRLDAVVDALADSQAG